MQLVTVVMIGVALGRVAMFIGEYLTKGWDGDIIGAAKSLARGLAVGAIELIFALIFDLGAIIKAARNGLRATLRGAAAATKQSLRTVAESGRRLGRAAVGAIRAPGQAARMVGGAVVRKGRLVFRGLRGGFGRGARSLDELAQRLFERVRFRRFKIRLRRGRIQLLGYINPWVLLADGDLQQITGIETGGSPLELGDVIEVGRRKGFLVGVKDLKQSAAVAELRAMKPSARKSIYREFATGTQDDIRRFLTNKETTAQLRKGIPGPQPPHFQAHHVVPRELRKNARIKDFLDDIAFNFEDGARNGIMLPPNDVLRAQHPQWASATLHFTSHPGYTQRVAQRLTQLADAYEQAIKSGVSRQQAKSVAAQQLDQYLATLKQNLMSGTEQLK
jgi:A nuclease family of the HNH/ENDO VII superfamily with conserved AHH